MDLERVCPVCGKQFTAPTWNPKRMCCSPECAKICRYASRAKKPPRPREDLTGRVINGHTALRYLSRNIWVWRCSCGKEFTAMAANIKSGYTKSCGHALAERSREWVNTNREALQSGMLKRIVDGELRSTNTSGVTGVVVIYNVASIVYSASIIVNRRRIYLGRYATLEAARQARKDAEKKYFVPRILPDNDDK